MSKNDIPAHIKPYLSDKYYYDPSDARKVILFIENFLYFFNGQFAGKPFVLMRWQKELIEKVYGIKTVHTHLRRFKTVYCLIPRKNAKTTTMAAILLYELVCGEGMNQECYTAANSREQSSLILNIMKGLIHASPYLSKLLKIQKNQIHNPKTGSFIKTLSRDGKTVHGTNPAIFVYDEIAFAPDDTLYESLATGQGAQKEPLAILIGTASPNKSGWGYSLYEYAKKIEKDESINESFLPIIYAAEEDDDWKSQKVWEKANPSLGETITLDYLKQEFIKTKEFPSYVNSFKLFYLNMHVDSDDAWIDSNSWNKCADDSLSIDDFTGDSCWIGIDLSATNDLTAVVAVFEREGRFFVFPKPFVPVNSLETKERIHKVPYTQWADDGYLTATHGNQGMVVDYDAVAEHIDWLREHFDVQSIYIDPWASAAFINLLKNEHMDLLIMTRQGYGTMSKITTETEKLVIADKLVHPNNPVLNWNVMNVVLESDAAGNVKPSKKKSVNKIDCAVAMIMACGGAVADLCLEEGDAEVLFL